MCVWEPTALSLSLSLSLCVYLESGLGVLGGGLLLVMEGGARACEFHLELRT